MVQTVHQPLVARRVFRPAQLADHGVSCKPNSRAQLLVSSNVQNLKEAVLVVPPKLFPCVLDFDARHRGDE